MSFLNTFRNTQFADRYPIASLNVHLRKIFYSLIFQDWEFPDGSPPPPEIRDKWIQLVKNRVVSDPGSCIAVHCVAGLGRAPVLVALALMEAGMKYEDAVELIRQHRRGAINQKQLTYLQKYKASGELKKLKCGKRDKDFCLMM
ncbi:unnamed protein product [Soboliphyme baturini]|uniref:Protein tyrosine phosphatase type IVA 3 n=1 Tax=Soboliphyme baturini TaxID=241478 RepID=A0A183IB05_9BILA|nr:unnamed protein product [Soboliphyme baturini]